MSLRIYVKYTKRLKATVKTTQLTLVVKPVVNNWVMLTIPFINNLWATVSQLTTLTRHPDPAPGEGPAPTLTRPTCMLRPALHRGATDTPPDAPRAPWMAGPARGGGHGGRTTATLMPQPGSQRRAHRLCKCQCCPAVCSTPLCLPLQRPSLQPHSLHSTTESPWRYDDAFPHKALPCPLAARTRVCALTTSIPVQCCTSATQTWGRGCEGNVRGPCMRATESTSVRRQEGEGAEVSTL